MSSDNKPMLIESFEAEVAISKYQAVIYGTADDQVDLPAAAGDRCVGIAMHDAAIGERVDVVTFGPYTCLASAAIARGALVRISNTSGQVDDVTGGVTTATSIVGESREAAAAAGDHVSVFVGKNSHGAV